MEYIAELLIVIGIVVTAIRSSDHSYFHRFFLFLDFFVASVIWGESGLTISSRSGIAHREGKLWGKIACRLLNLIQKNHCEIALESDKERARKTFEYLNKL